MALQNVEANITLDLYNHDTTHATVKAIQLDSQTRYVAAMLQNVGMQYDVDSGATVQLIVVRPDNVGVQITGETFEYGEEGAQFLGPYAELTQVALAVSGKMRGQFKITSGTQILRTEIFAINNGVALDASTDEWAGQYDGYNLDELVERVDAAVEKVDGMEADVTELKSGLNATNNIIELNAGNEILNNWQESSYYRLSSSATSVDINAPVTTGASGYKSLFVACQAGDVFYLTATGTTSARPYAFLSNASGENNIIARASSNEYENYRLVAPQNSTYAVFNAKKSNPSNIIKGELAKDAGRNLDNIDIPWEVGNIVFSSDGATYNYDRTSRARTPEGYSLRLHVGDVIGMTDYSDAEFYTAWTDVEGAFHYTNVKTSNYTITQDGDYIFLLRNIAEVDITADITALTNLFFVKVVIDANQLYRQANDYAERYVSISDSGLNSHLFKKVSPKFAMHRGYSTFAPENTAPAFELAGQNGAWGIETDIYETTDGHFVCHHDATVDRMTDGSGNISGMSLAQIEALTIDAGANIESYPNLKIPTLETFLAICRRYGCVGFIEIKTVTNINNVVSLIRTKGMENNVIILVANRNVVPKWRYYTTAPIAYIGYNNSDNTKLVNEISSFENSAVDFEASTIADSTHIEYAHSKNMPVIVWVTDSESRADELFRLGVDVVTSNSIPKFI